MWGHIISLFSRIQKQETLTGELEPSLSDDLCLCIPWIEVFAALFHLPACFQLLSIFWILFFSDEPTPMHLTLWAYSFCFPLLFYKSNVKLEWGRNILWICLLANFLNRWKRKKNTLLVPEHSSSKGMYL